MAHDEHLDHIPQAVAEYLANNHAVEVDGEERRIEAIIYRSAQPPIGKNIALLGVAAFVGMVDADRTAEGDRGGPGPDSRASTVSVAASRWLPSPAA